MEIGTPQQINTIVAIFESDKPVLKLDELRHIYRTEVLEHIDMVNGERIRMKGADIIIKSIINSKTLSDDEYISILRKQQSNKQITDDEVLSLNKMIYMKVFKFLDIDKMKIHMDLIYNNIDTVKNYDNLLFNQNSNNVISRLVKDDNDILGKFEMTKLVKINTILQNLGFEFKDDIIMNKETVNFEDSKNMIIEFIQKNKTLFNCERIFKNLNWLKCFNDMLGLYGLETIKSRVNRRVNGAIEVSYNIDLTKKDVLDVYVKNYRNYYITKINDLENYKNIDNKKIKDINKLTRYDLKMYYIELKNDNHYEIDMDIITEYKPVDIVEPVAIVELVQPVSKVKKIQFKKNKFVYL
jgi:hypothetical protein